VRLPYLIGVFLFAALNMNWILLVLLLCYAAGGCSCASQLPRSMPDISNPANLGMDGTRRFLSFCSRWHPAHQTECLLGSRRKSFSRSRTFNSSQLASTVSYTQLRKGHITPFICSVSKRFACILTQKWPQPKSNIQSSIFQPAKSGS
jgi:hypothetical protein